MNKNRKFVKRSLALALSAAVLAPATFIQAAQFKDVPANHWAYSYIDAMSSRGVIAGYSDHTYKPAREVQFLEVMRLIEGVINLSSTETNNAKAQYGEVVRQMNVPSWAQQSICVALYRGVLDVETLNQAKKNGMVSYNPTAIPDRSSVAVYYARALQLKKKSDISNLKQSDLASINQDVKEYLSALVDAGVFDAYGANGKFEGKRGIRRDEMARITHDAYKYNEKASQEKTFEGKVTLVSSGIGNKQFVVEKGSEKLAVNYNESTSFSLNGKTAKAEDLKEGQEVKVTYKEVDTNLQQTGRLASKVELKKTESSVYGRLIRLNRDSITLYYTENQSSVDFFRGDLIGQGSKEFTLPRDIKVTSYGLNYNLNNIKEDDIVELKSINGELKEVKVYKREKGYLEGTVEKIEDSKKYSAQKEITIKLNNGEKETYYVTDRSFSLPRVGEKVRYSMKYKVIDSVSFGQDGQTMGRVYDASYSAVEGNTLVLTESNGQRVKYRIKKDAKILKNGSSFVSSLLTQRDLDNLIGKFVNIKVDNGYVEEIEIVEGVDNYYIGSITIISAEPAGGGLIKYTARRHDAGYIYDREMTFKLEDSGRYNLIRGQKYEIQTFVDASGNPVGKTFKYRLEDTSRRDWYSQQARELK
ncbi:MAG: S-layer homology domain-containing protein [Peptoniphilus sp. oral taxon 375]|nr:S-layer homology domain-containing protein [Peptoniphilus sp. oral taxon 375]